MLTGMVPADIRLGTGEYAAQLNYRLFLAVHHLPDGSNAHDRLVALVNTHVIRIHRRSLGGIRPATVTGFSLIPWNEQEQQAARGTLDFGVVAALGDTDTQEQDFPINEIYLRLRPFDADFVKVYP